MMNNLLNNDLIQFNNYLLQIYETWPLNEKLKTAINYSLLANGKRLRPLLFFTILRSFNESNISLYFPAAAAIEMIHNYSLIHDDLPAMDNDDLRRGKPTNHVAFGEDIAILAGDALLTDSFRILTQTPVKAEQIVQMTQVLAKAAGSENMVSGQVEDIKMVDKSISNITIMDQQKTAAMFVAASDFGIICLQLPSKVAKQLRIFANSFGLAFQLFDDLKDLSEESAELKNYAADFGIVKTQKAKAKYLNQSSVALDKIDDPNFNPKLLKKFLLQIS